MAQKITNTRQALMLNGYVKTRAVGSLSKLPTSPSVHLIALFANILYACTMGVLLCTITSHIPLLLLLPTSLYNIHETTFILNYFLFLLPH